MDSDVRYSLESADKRSVVAVAQNLVGKTLRDVARIDSLDSFSSEEDPFEAAIIQYFANSSKPLCEYDGAFERALSIKAFPVKIGRNGQLVAKDRLFLGKIGFSDILDEPWETSLVRKQYGKLLLLAYLYEPCTNPVDYIFQFADFWAMPDEDAYTIQRDWETVVGKISSGRAHEISSGDTLYLEAYAKDGLASGTVPQPLSDIPAIPRYWAFKKSFVMSLVHRMSDAQKISRSKLQSTLPLSELVRQHFDKYVGYTEEDLGEIFGLTQKGKRPPKSLSALITRRILGVAEDSKILEFEKAGIVAKTIRLKRNGVPKYPMSFPKFDYCKLAVTPFEDSDFRGYLEQKYLLVIFREDDEVRNEYHLDSVLFWQMPESDIPEARRCYKEMQRRVRDGHADQSVKATENRCCHVRPHGRNAEDTCMTPYGVPVIKKSFWFNSKYIAGEIQRLNTKGLSVG